MCWIWHWVSCLGWQVGKTEKTIFLHLRVKIFQELFSHLSNLFSGWVFLVGVEKGNATFYSCYSLDEYKWVERSSSVFQLSLFLFITLMDNCVQVFFWVIYTDEYNRKRDGFTRDILSRFKVVLFPTPQPVSEFKEDIKMQNVWQNAPSI